MHKFQCRVYYEDTDLAGIVYYANYLKFIERARSEWVRELGVDQAQIKQDLGIVFAVRKLEADYMSAAKYDDLLEITTQVTKATPARLCLKQSIAVDDAEIFEAQVTLVAISDEGRATRFPIDFRQKITLS